MKTRTGSFPIGFRRGGGEWQSDLGALINWATSHGLEVIDLRPDAPVSGQAVLDAKMRIGTVDLPNNKGMIAADAGKRRDAVAQNSEHVRQCAKLGRVNHFLVMLPDDPMLPAPRTSVIWSRASARWRLCWNRTTPASRSKVGPDPGALCCTPEGYRAFFTQVPSQAMGVNYDPSHLIRQGIDHLRFLREFAARVYHVHGKDTEFLTENVYEYGTEQPPTFAKPLPFAGMAWRYTIPGHGVSRWVDIFRILQSTGYDGCVSVELEDANFYRLPEGGTGGHPEWGHIPGGLLDLGVVQLSLCVGVRGTCPSLASSPAVRHMDCFFSRRAEFGASASNGGKVGSPAV